MPKEKIGKTGVIAKVVEAMAGMTPGQIQKAYKGMNDAGGNKSSITAKGNAAAPMKWSPEDQRANIRRKMYNVESEDWLNSLPELETISETREIISEEE